MRFWYWFKQIVMAILTGIAALIAVAFFILIIEALYLLTFLIL